MEETLEEKYKMLISTLMKQSWKCIRRSAAGTVLSFVIALLTAFVTMESTPGHVFS